MDLSLKLLVKLIFTSFHPLAQPAQHRSYCTMRLLVSRTNFRFLAGFG
jgi:hypothetical protein